MLKPGYKQTDLGVLPEEWEVVDIEQIADVKGGKRLPLGSTLTNQVTPHPYIRIVDVFQGGVSLQDIKYVPADAFPAIRNYRIYKDDLFITVAGTLGLVGKIPKELDGANLTENADRLTNLKCNQDYLLWVMLSPFVQAAIEEEKTTGAQPKLALTRIKKFQIPLPSLNEQQAIADALGALNALQTSQEELLTKKRDLKLATQQALLSGERRLSGFAGKWEEKTLGGLGTCIRGVSYNPEFDLQPNDTPSTLRLLRSNNVAGGFVNFDSLQFVESSRVKHSQIMRANDILICMANGSKELVGKAGIFKPDSRFSYTFGAFMAAYRPDEKACDPTFAFYLFQTEDYRKNIGDLLAGSSINNLNPSAIHSIAVTIPPPTEQRAIAAILSDMDAEIEALAAQLAKTQALKQGMMQDLLTGTIRLTAGAAAPSPTPPV